MKSSERMIWAAAIVLIDLLVIGVPLTAFVAAYVLVARPAWFKDFFAKVYQGE